MQTDRIRFEDFLQGNDKFRPIALWSLNHRLEKAELERQVEQMALQGVGGFIMHARSGLLTPYMSEEWLDCIEHAVKAAQKHHLDAWLYDEDPYPSGVAGGRVVADRPDFKAQTLACHQTTHTGPGVLTMDLPMAKVCYAYALRKEQGKIVQKIDLSGHIGTMRTQWTAAKQYNSYYPGTYSQAYPQYRSDTFSPHLQLEWNAPDGQWEIMVFTRSICGQYFMYESYTDMLNPKAIEYFIQTTYDKYKERLQPYFGNTIPGIFIDEPKYYSNPLPWTDALPQRFKERYGYEIDNALCALFTPGEDARPMRKDFWELTQDTFMQTFPKQVRKWCEDSNLQLIGHCSPEEEPADQVLMTGSIMHFMKEMHLPGTDLITMMTGSKKCPIVNMGAMLAASAARQWRDGNALCEAFGVMEWQLKPSDMVRICNWLYVVGIHGVVHHAFIYSLDGYRKMDAAPSEFYQMPWWKNFGEYSDYLATLGYMLVGSENIVRTGFLYPMDTFMALQPQDAPAAKEYRDLYTALFTLFVHNHIPFDFVDYRDFTQAPCENGKLIVGDMHYDHFVVPPLAYLSPETKQKLIELEKGGVQIVYAQTSDSRFAAANEMEIEANRVFTVNGSEDIGFTFHGESNILQSMQHGIRICNHGDKTPATQIMLRHVKKNDEDVLFLYNAENEDTRVEIELYGQFTDHSLLEYRPGATRPLAVAVTHGLHQITFAAGQASFYVLQKESPLPCTPVEEELQYLPAVYSLTAKDRNCALLDRWSISVYKDQPLDRLDMAREVVYQLPAVGKEKFPTPAYPCKLLYKTMIYAQDIPQNLSLVRELSAIQGNFTLYANGRPLDEWQRNCIYDCNNYEASLEFLRDAQDRRFFRNGELVIAVLVDVENESMGLLHPLRIFGDFTLWLNNNESIGATMIPGKETPDASVGSLLRQGYPYYAGCLEYSQTFNIQDVSASQYAILVDAGGDSMEICINGQSAGKLIANPYEKAITPFIQEGENALTVRVWTTLENLLYGVNASIGLQKPIAIRRSKS